MITQSTSAYRRTAQQRIPARAMALCLRRSTELSVHALATTHAVAAPATAGFTTAVVNPIAGTQKSTETVNNFWKPLGDPPAPEPLLLT